jgi:signal transduction histidine kinase
MMLKFPFVVTLPALLLGGSVWAAEYGTADEAKAMLERAVAEVKTDKAKALEMFIKGEGGFMDRDLYPYCVGPDGKFTAHPKLVGQDAKDLKDKTGKSIGDEIAKTVEDLKPGEIGEVSYMFPRPNETEPVQKIAYVTKVDDQVCAVGYYK